MAGIDDQKELTVRDRQTLDFAEQVRRWTFTAMVPLLLAGILAVAWKTYGRIDELGERATRVEVTVNDTMRRVVRLENIFLHTGDLQFSPPEPRLRLTP